MTDGNTTDQELPAAPPSAAPPALPGSQPQTLPVPPGTQSGSLPPTPGTQFAAAPPPTGPRRRFRTRYIVIAVVVVVLVIGGIVSLVSRQNSRFTIVPSASTDGTFHAGDCVTLTSTSVHYADCAGAHDAQIIQVIQGTGSCPAGTQEFDVTDNTGNLCLDKGNSSS